jgi:DNA mismatch repair protein MutL
MEIIITNEDFDISKFIDKVAKSVACKASIRANENITLADMEILIDRLRECDNPFTCAHGRPCIITYSRYDLDKLFKRALC